MLYARSFVVKMSFISMGIKNHLHILFYSFTLILALEQRLGETRKWPIREGALIIQKEGWGGGHILERSETVYHCMNMRTLTHLIFILFLTIRTTSLALPHILSLHTARTPSTIR